MSKRFECDRNRIFRLPFPPWPHTPPASVRCHSTGPPGEPLGRSTCRAWWGWRTRRNRSVRIHFSPTKFIVSRKVGFMFTSEILWQDTRSKYTHAREIFTQNFVEHKDRRGGSKESKKVQMTRTTRVCFTLRTQYVSEWSSTRAPFLLFRTLCLFNLKQCMPSVSLHSVQKFVVFCWNVV